MTHNRYEDGRLQSISFTSWERRHSVGVIAPGEYDFGLAKRSETIRVLEGIIIGPDDVLYTQTNGPLVFEEGQPIRFATTEMTAYICHYG